jgi:hypothetical protein
MAAAAAQVEHAGGALPSQLRFDLIQVFASPVDGARYVVLRAGGVMPGGEILLRQGHKRSVSR